MSTLPQTGNEPRDVEVSVLSEIAHTLVDQVVCYGCAAEIAKHPDVQTAVQAAKAAHAKLLHDVNGKIWILEIPPIDQGAALGIARKRLLEQRAVIHNDDKAAVSEVLRSEAYLIDKLTDAINDERLAAHTRNYLATVLSRVQTVADDICRLSERI